MSAGRSGKGATAADAAGTSRASRRWWSRGQGSNVPPLRGLLLLAVVLGVWQVVQHGRSAYFPRPSLWWDAVVKDWGNGTLSPAIGATVTSFVYSLIIATVLGVVLGIVIGRSRAADRAFGPLLDFLRFTPAAAVVPIVVLFAGYTENMTIAVVVFAAIWPILLHVRDAVRAQSPLLADVARSLHLGRVHTISKITVPSLVPGILLGVRVAAPMVLIVVLLVEIITQTGGLGSLITAAQQSFDAASAYGVLCIAGVFGIAINAVVATAEAWLLRYRAASATR